MTPPMEYTGLTLTEGFESCRLEAYLDSKGVPTIGFGHTHGVTLGDTCTQDQADLWLEQDAQSAIYTVNHYVAIRLTQGEFDALVDFVFNVGAGNFFNSTLLRKLNSGDIEGASAEFERWDMSGGQHIAGLLRRRKAEQMVFDGDPPAS